MSSLINSYRKLTDPTNQGIFDNEELLLSLGRVYAASFIDIPFGVAEVVDFIISSGDDFVATGDISIQSDSEEFLVEFFSIPIFTGGTPIPLIQQTIGNTRVPLSSLLTSPSISNDGVSGTKSVIKGISGQGNQSGFSKSQKETLNLLSPNTSILFRVTNRGSIGVLDLSVRIGELPTGI